MDEETLLRRKILDTANKSYNQNIYTYTGFLGLSELAIYNSMKKELQFAYPSTFGGSESSERQIIRFGSPEIFGYDDSFQYLKFHRLHQNLPRNLNTVIILVQL